ncbi:MAG: hypothetical protein D6B25_06380 [Desulfobulbaceae bacterium]|nr:MAG: hypothetical protein D6B25_06380 [Desulfobulbaceae bacterium]
MCLSAPFSIQSKKDDVYGVSGFFYFIEIVESDQGAFGITFSHLLTVDAKRGFHLPSCNEQPVDMGANVCSNEL